MWLCVTTIEHNELVLGLIHRDIWLGLSNVNISNSYSRENIKWVRLCQPSTPSIN